MLSIPLPGLARQGIAEPTLSRHVEQAVDWLLSHAVTFDDQLPGLHFGEAGVAVAICEAVRAGLISTGSWLEEYLEESLAAPLDPVARAR